MKALISAGACAVLVAGTTAGGWNAQAAQLLPTNGSAASSASAGGSTQARAEEGWLPDPAWGPWYRYTDPTGNNPDSGRGPLEFAPGRVGIDSAGRIIVAGLRFDQRSGTACDLNKGWKSRIGDQNIAVSRYLPDGTLDTSYGDEGTRIVPHATHRIDISDMVVSGDEVYVAGDTDIIGCGIRPIADMSWSVAKVTAAGEVDGQFGMGGRWDSPETSFEGVSLSNIGAGAVGAFYGGKFALLSGADISMTDLSEHLCLPRTWDIVGSIGGCPSGRLEGNRSDVAGLLRYSPVGGPECDCIGTNQTLRVFFGRLDGAVLEPNEQAGDHGVVSTDLSRLLGDKRLLGAGWSTWDSQGRLIVITPASEGFPAIGTGEFGMEEFIMEHGRGLVSARFARTESGGFALDQAYGDGGATYVPLPFSGGDTFWPSALMLDSNDRLVVVSEHMNTGSSTGGQFALRITGTGSVDADYGQGGLLWLPEGTPSIGGQAALDSGNNVYFAKAWNEFATRSVDPVTRKKRSAPYQLGRFTPRGVVEAHDGSRWVRTTKHPPAQSAVRLMSKLPTEVRKGDQVTVRVKVLANKSGDPYAKASTPVARADITAYLFGAPGKPTMFVVAKGRSNSRGVARLTFRLNDTGFFSVTASAKGRIVGSGTPVTKITVRRR